MKLETIEAEITLQLAEQTNNDINSVGVQTHASIKEALAYVQHLAGPGDIILLFGSFHLVAELGVEHV